MFKPVSLFLAWRYAFSKNRKGFAAFISASSTIGIGLGVMILIIVLSAMNGFERALADKLLSVVPHGELVAVEDPISNWPKVVKQAQNHERVLAAAPEIKLSAMAQKAGQLKGIEVRGVDANLMTTVSDIDQYIVEGTWPSLENIDVIVLGKSAADKLGVSVGEQLQLLMPPAQQDFSKSLPAPIVRQMTVGAIFKFGGVIDDTLGLINLATAQKILGYDASTITSVRLKVDDVFQARKITRDLAYQMDYYVYIFDWTRTQGHLFQDIQLVRMVMYLVLALVIAVASFNIVSTLIMVVNEKKGDIAMLRTMGAASSTVMLCFMLQGLVNGVIGTIVGAVLGVYFSENLTALLSKLEQALDTKLLSGDIYFVDYIPSELVWQDVYSTIAIALAMSLFATLYPAWRATKIDPAKVLGQL